MLVMLNEEELSVLFKQDPSKKNGGGFQRFLVNLQEKTDRTTGAVELSEDDLKKIPHYAFDCGPGGFEGRIKSIFERCLGQSLGR